MDQRVASKTSELFTQAFPTRIKAVHLVFAANFQLGFMHNVVSFLCQLWGICSSYLFLHHSETPEQALMKLVPHGIYPSALPPSLGGSYKPDVDFARFLTQLGFRLTPQTSTGTWNDDAASLAGRCDTSSDERTASTRENDQQLITDAGTTNSSTTNDQSKFAVRHLRCLHEAIDVLPDSDKASYLQAIGRAPELVEEESPPLVFLDYADYDARAAVRCISASAFMFICI